MSSNNGKFEYEIITPGKIVPRLTIVNSGAAREGKTSFMLSAPGPIAILSNDPNTRAVCELVAKRDNKKIIFKDFLKPSVGMMPSMSINDELNYHKNYWREYKEAYYKFLEMKEIRSIGIDTGTIMYRDARFALLGRPRIDVLSEINAKGEATEQKVGIDKIQQRDYGPVKEELRNMIVDCSTTNKNLVINCWDTDEWANNARTGRKKYDGMPGMNFLASAETWQYRAKDTGEFRIVIMNSTANGDRRGRIGDYRYVNDVNKYVPGPDELVSDDVSFPMVALAIFPDSSEYEDWV